jgi:hypothetical protein
MSERRALRAIAWVALGVLSAWPTSASAQTGHDAPSGEERLARRMRALEADYARAAAAADSADAVARLRADDRDPQDTTFVGPLRIVTTRSQLEEAEVRWREAWAEFEPILGSHGADLARFTFTHDLKPTRSAFDVTGEVKSVAFRRPVRPDAVRRQIRAVIGSAALSVLPAKLQRWSGGTALGSANVPARRYRSFVRSPTALAQACVDGSPDACWTALGQMDPTADVVATWFTPDEQRSIMATRGTPLIGARSECRAGVDRSCREVVVARVLGLGEMPLSAGLRADLLWFALRRGGPGAVDRLNASFGDAIPEGRNEGAVYATDAAHVLGPLADIKTHLARAADMDGDVLIELWRQSVMQGRPSPPATDERTRTSTILWVMLFAALSSRSSRWRLG